MTNKGKMIEAIYAASLTKRATLVIFYLINRANQELTCFPSVGTIARECNISTRTVQRAMNDLEEAGFLERESRFHERGGQKSSLYRINEQVVVRSEMDEVDFDSLIDMEKPEEKMVVASKDVTKMDSVDEVEDSVVKKLIKWVKRGFSYILSWGL
jgi:predicted transcriptional regulator